MKTSHETNILYYDDKRDVVTKSIRTKQSSQLCALMYSKVLRRHIKTFFHAYSRTNMGQKKQLWHRDIPLYRGLFY